jgi:hypothetical protein
MAEAEASQLNHGLMELEDAKGHVSHHRSITPTVPRKKTFAQTLAIYTGSYSKDNLIKLLIAPFVTLLNPGALYTIITGGLMIAWYVGTAIIQTQLFSAAPYVLNASQIGYLSAGPLLGGTIGSTFIALISDPLVKWATARNKGI